MTGILNVNKAAGITSAGVVNRVKRLLPRGTKIGHAGTLDPFATGVLLLLIGPATKWCETMMDRPKSYDTTVRLGATTATDDLESDPIPVPVTIPPSLEQVQDELDSFVGTILQVPPAYSALRIGGRRAYQLARRGTVVNHRPRSVTVYRLKIVDYHWPDLRLTVECGRGFYVRSLARELGQVLGVGGYLTSLCRTRVGPFTRETAVSITELSVGDLINQIRDADGQLSSEAKTKSADDNAIETS